MKMEESKQQNPPISSNDQKLPIKPRKKSKTKIIFIILFAFILVAGLSAGGVYIVMKRSENTDTSEKNDVVEEENEKDLKPEEAYDLAMAKFTDDDYYEYSSVVELPVELSVPGFSKIDLNMDIEGTEDGKINLKDGDSYYLTELSVDLDKSLTEAYYIDGKVYAREDLEDDFTEYTEEEAAENSIKHSAVLDVIVDISDDVEYTVLENEDLSGREHYVYQIEITQEDLSGFIEELNRSIESSGFQVSQEDTTITDALIMIWIDKENITVSKGILTIGDITFTGTYQGYNVTFALTDIEAEMIFDKWGEIEEIKLPEGED